MKTVKQLRNAKIADHIDNVDRTLFELEKMFYVSDTPQSRIGLFKLAEIRNELMTVREKLDIVDV